MDGITVLNVVAVKDFSFWPLFLLALGIGGAVGGVCAVCESYDFLSIALSSICVFASVFLLITIISNWGKFQTKTSRYECLVDKSVSVEELYEKYDVVERRGEIWVLEEKENDE